MKRFLKQFRYGEKGFTLIELLVVVAILGVMAAVLIPNVGKFMGKGTVEAANTEAHNVRIAVLSAMVDAGVTRVCDPEDPATECDDNKVGPGDPLADPPDINDPDITASDGSTNIPVSAFFTGSLQAIYTIGEDGQITDATTEGVTESRWAGANLEWTDNSWHEPE